jgi:hypothetical protein
VMARCGEGGDAGASHRLCDGHSGCVRFFVPQQGPTDGTACPTPAA